MYVRVGSFKGMQSAGSKLNISIPLVLFIDDWDFYFTLYLHDLLEMYKEIFGDIFFSYRDPSSRDIRLAPTMQTNNYGQTTGRTQIAQNNYAPAGRPGIAPFGMMPAVAFVQPTMPRGGKKLRKSRRKKTRRRRKRKGKTRKKKNKRR